MFNFYSKNWKKLNLFSKFQFKFNLAVNGCSQGSSIKVAKTSCALSLVRQFFHMGIIAAANELSTIKKPSASNVTFYL